jgi:hypothetical protein
MCLLVFGLGAVSVACVCLLYCLSPSGVVATLFLLNTMHAHHDLEKNNPRSSAD